MSDHHDAHFPALGAVADELLKLRLAGKPNNTQPDWNPRASGVRSIEPPTVHDGALSGRRGRGRPARCGMWPPTIAARPAGAQGLPAGPQLHRSCQAP